MPPNTTRLVPKWALLCWMHIRMPKRIREKARQEAAAFTDGAVQTAQSVMDGVHSLRSNLDAVRDRIRSITAEFETQLGNIYQCLEDAATQAETFRQNLQSSSSSDQDIPSFPV